MRNHALRITSAVALALFGLSSAGCDDGKKVEPSAKTEAPGKAAAGAPPAAAAGAVAAAGEPSAAEDAADPLADIDKRVQRAAALAKKIEAEPEKAGDILDAAGLGRDEFEELIFEISADASLAKQYQAAMVAQTG